MQRKLLIVSLATLAITALLSAACNAPNTTASSNPQATPAAATDQSPRQRYLVTRTHVKPEMMAQFHDFYLKETLPAMQKGGVKQQSVWTTARLGESFEYITIRPIEGIQYFDEPGEIAKALGEEGTRKWAAKRGAMIVRSQSYITQDRPDLSIAPSADYVAKLIAVTRRTVLQSHATDYEDAFKNDIMPIFKKTNPKGFVTRKVGSGGNGNEYISAVMVDSFAEYEKWTAALLKEGFTAANAKRASFITQQESAFYRYVPELSLPQPPAQTAEKK